MRLQLRFFALAGAVLALSCSSLAQIKKVGSAYLFRVKYVKGQTIKLQTVNSVEGIKKGNQPLKINVPVSIKVLSVSQGISTLSLAAGPASMGGKKINAPVQQALIKVDSRNAPVGGASNLNLGATYPQAPIKVGQTWTSKTAINLGGSPSTMTAVYKLLGVKKVGKTEVAALSMRVSGVAQGTGTMHLSTADGTIQDCNLKLKLVVGSGNPIDVTSIVKRTH
jgi:hypothetical protein